MFSFRESDSGDSDGDFLKGVFYRDGDVETYADPENSCFYQSEGHVWYDDGIRIFELPGSYTLGDDGLAYDKNGQVFANAQDWKKYDPSADWGKDWAIMWYDSES